MRTKFYDHEYQREQIGKNKVGGLVGGGGNKPRITNPALRAFIYGAAGLVCGMILGNLIVFLIGLIGGG